MTTNPTPPTEKTSRAPVIAALSVLGLVLVVAFGSWLVRDDEMWTGSAQQSASPSATAGGAETVVSLGLPTQDTARCMPVDAETLGKAQTAFDGEVLSADADTVTLAVRQWYAGGDDAARVRLDLARVPATLAGYFDFQEGKRYLVSANDGVVRVCGFSGPWSADLEAIYTEAFPGS